MVRSIERPNHVLVLFPADFHVQMQRLAIFLGDEFLFDPCKGMIGKLSLGRFDGAQHAGLWR